MWIIFNIGEKQLLLGIIRLFARRQGIHRIFANYRKHQSAKFEFGLLQKSATLGDLEAYLEYCKMTGVCKKSVSIQPRTSLPKRFSGGPKQVLHPLGAAALSWIQVSTFTPSSYASATQNSDLNSHPQSAIGNNARLCKDAFEVSFAFRFERVPRKIAVSLLRSLASLRTEEEKGSADLGWIVAPMRSRPFRGSVFASVQFGNVERRVVSISNACESFLSIARNMNDCFHEKA